MKGTQNGSHAKPSPVAARRSNPTKARDDDGDDDDDDKHFVSHASERRRSGVAKAE